MNKLLLKGNFEGSKAQDTIKCMDVELNLLRTGNEEQVERLLKKLLNEKRKETNNYDGTSLESIEVKELSPTMED